MSFSLASELPEAECFWTKARNWFEKAWLLVFRATNWFVRASDENPWEPSEIFKVLVITQKNEVLEIFYCEEMLIDTIFLQLFLIPNDMNASSCSETVLLFWNNSQVSGQRYHYLNVCKPTALQYMKQIESKRGKGVRSFGCYNRFLNTSDRHELDYANHVRTIYKIYLTSGLYKSSQANK